MPPACSASSRPQGPCWSPCWWRSRASASSRPGSESVWGAGAWVTSPPAPWPRSPCQRPTGCGGLPWWPLGTEGPEALHVGPSGPRAGLRAAAGRRCWASVRVRDRRRDSVLGPGGAATPPADRGRAAQSQDPSGGSGADGPGSRPGRPRAPGGGRPAAPPPPAPRARRDPAPGRTSPRAPAPTGRTAAAVGPCGTRSSPGVPGSSERVAPAGLGFPGWEPSCLCRLPPLASSAPAGHEPAGMTLGGAC